MRSFRAAFTLTEVLLTIAIIGIVAILLLPTVINKYQDRIFEIQAKKVKNELSSSFNLLFAEERVQTLYETSLFIHDVNQESVENSLGKLFAGFLKTSNDCGYTNSQTQCRETMISVSEDSEQQLDFPGVEAYCGKLKSGPLVCLTPYTGGDFIYAYVDLNNDKSPNVIEKDVIVFSIGQKATVDRTYFNGGEFAAQLNLNDADPSEIANTLTDVLGISYDDAVSLVDSSDLGAYGKADCDTIKETLEDQGAIITCESQN